MKLEDYIINIDNFPKEGIIFRDITGILNDKDGFKLAIDRLQENLNDIEYDTIVGVESRGFIFGSPLAYNNNKKFVLARKHGKLPREVVTRTYSLEYGTANIDLHRDSIKEGDKVVIVDDLLATGGTVGAVVDLVKELGGEVVCCNFLIELDELNGREKLNKLNVKSCLHF